MKSLFRFFRRELNIFRLKRKHKGLKTLGSVDIVNCELGQFNLICDGTTISSSSLGDYSYVGANCRISRAVIGKFCSIGPNVSIAPGKHPIDFVSTHPVFYSTTFLCDNRFASQQGFVETGNVEIGHDVWIGNRATILDGVKIGTGAIVAAHSIVNRDVEPYSIVGGTPAKPIRLRFSSEEIEQLLESEWWERDEKFLRENAHLFARSNAVEQLISVLKETRVGHE